MVREVLKPFVEEICEDENTKIKVVLFSRKIEHIEIPSNRQSAGNLIEQRVYASGGTDFYEASKGLVDAATQMLQAHPTFQVLCAFSCSFSKIRNFPDFFFRNITIKFSVSLQYWCQSMVWFTPSAHGDHVQ